MTKKPNTTHYGFDSRIVADAMTEHMPKIVEDMYYFVDSIMSGHGAKFVFHEDEPEYGFSDDQYLDKQMYYDAHLEVLSQLCGYLWQSLPPVLEAYEAPYILPHQLVQDFTKAWFDEIADNKHASRDRLWKLHILEEMSKELDNTTDEDTRSHLERLIKKQREEIERFRTYEAANEGVTNE